MGRKQRVIVLGATGSIGQTALEVVRDFPERFEIVGLSSHRNTDLLRSLSRELAPRAVCVSGGQEEPPRGGTTNGFCAVGATTCEEPPKGGATNGAGGTTNGFGAACEVFEGQAGLTALIERCDADLLVVATVGLAGLEPTLAGIARGMRIALANKEVLVAGGALVLARAHEAGVEVVPLDSEHSAIMQCLAGCDRRDVRRLVLTASGGPLRGMAPDKVDCATPEQALCHPTWRMGRKITVDSATLMNKGLEVIEACHLFGVPPEQIAVVVHPQSIVHSLVEFRNGTVLAQMGPTSMYLPILAGMAWPERPANKLEPLDLTRLGRLDFSAPDTKAFPCLAYAYEAIAAGGLLPAVLSAANEVAVEAFLVRRIPFGAIAGTVRHAMDRFLEEAPGNVGQAFQPALPAGPLQTGKPEPPISQAGKPAPQELDLDTLRAADRRARETAEAYVAGIAA